MLIGNYVDSRDVSGKKYTWLIFNYISFRWKNVKTIIPIGDLESSGFHSLWAILQLLSNRKW